MINAKFLTITGMIFLAALSRLLPHPANVAPIMAIALFGGAKLSDKRAAFIVPLGAMFLSDLFLGFHNVMPVVYFCFLLTVALGFLLRQRRGVVPIAFAAFAASVLFFLITNFGVWAMTPLYSKTPAGLFACYVAALPFFQHSLIGDALYAATLFGGFALVERYLPSLQEVRAR